MEPWEQVHAALLQAGFHDGGLGSLGYTSYEGDLQVGTERVPVRLIFADDKFLRMPLLQIRTLPAWIPKSSAHLIGKEMPLLCYPGKETASIDRYHAGENVLAILDDAAKLLATLKQTAGAPLDIAHEFANYWGQCSLLLDLTGDQQPARLISGRLSEDRDGTLLITTQSHHQAFQAITDPDGWKEASVFFAYLTAVPPVPTNSDWPPKTLGTLRDWLHDSSPEAFRVLRDCFGWMYDQKRNAGFFVFKTPAVWFGFSVTLPGAYIDVRKISRKHTFIDLALGQRMNNVEISRWVASRVDTEYVVTRNLPDGLKSLAGQKILMVGAGAIGGYLADAMVRVGAGSGSGTLALVDPDRFTAGNIGRHRLTYDAIGRYKVDALAEELRRIQPWANVHPFRESVFGIGPIRDFDMIVDATGVRPLSLVLNEMYLAKDIKKLVSIWIYNNGISVHCLICADRAKGCRQCLYTAGDQKSYFPDAPENEKVNTGRGCDAAYVPYTVAPALAAATLGLQAVLDTINGNTQFNYRVSVLDRNLRAIKDKALNKIKDCQACSR